MVTALSLSQKQRTLELFATIVVALTATGCAHEPPLPPMPTEPQVTEVTTEELPEAESRRLTLRLANQDFVYVEDDVVVKEGPISSGKPQSPTPSGSFRVLSKHKDKVSSKYTNDLGMQAWMPYSLQFYGNYFLHEGWLPGHPASHGCVRLGHEDAQFLFERMKIGDPITVAR